MSTKDVPDGVRMPDDCTTMADVRAGVDALDRQLVALLATRFAYMRAAARIKPERGQVRDEARKAQVIEQARAVAEELGLPGDMMAALWDGLVEASIDYELEHWDARRVSAALSTKSQSPSLDTNGDWFD